MLYGELLVRHIDFYKNFRNNGVFRKLQTRENPKDFPHPANQHPGFVEILEARRDSLNKSLYRYPENFSFSI